MYRPILFAALLGLALPACTQPTPSAGKAEQAPSGDLDAAAFKARIDQGGAQLIDVRTAKEYAGGHIPGSTNIDWTAPDYETTFAQLDPATPVLLYCLAGGRSEQAKEYLEGKGFKVAHLVDGYSAWQKAGLPVEH